MEKKEIKRGKNMINLKLIKIFEDASTEYIGSSIGFNNDVSITSDKELNIDCIKEITTS